MRHKFKRLLAVALTLILCFSMVQPAYAANKTFDWDSWFKLIWNPNQSAQKPGDADQSTGSDKETSDNSQNTTLTLVEDESTVSEGTALRASTYVLNAATYAGDTVTTDSYSAVTMTYSDLYSNFQNTTYYYLSNGTYYEITNMTNKYYYRVYSDDYYNGDYSLTYGSSSDFITVYTHESKEVTLKYFPVTLYNYENGNKSINAATHQLELDNGTVTTWNGIYFGGNDWGASVGGSDSYGGTSANYANWNKWTGNFAVDGQETHGNKTYSGLVESTLDANKNIVFTKLEGGIFTSDTTNKDVYTNVGLPFVYDSEKGTYTFDADKYGVYYHDDEDQETSATPSSNANLYFSTTPQSHNFSAQDNRTRGWFPFNNTTSVTTAASSGNADYFFGMNATIPFTMTTNGRMNATDDNSDAITFSFSGDDDVWVFIDGVLVLDIGGVRNGMNATINFAENTWTITPMQLTINGTDRPAVDVNNAPMSGAIFNEGDTTGTLNQTRETFAATDSHELTIFYLERGAGSSNCKIQFNLPMKDTVSVKKLVRDTDSAGTTLDAETLAQINNRDFGFTLYKNGEFAANVNYSLLSENGQVISTPSTDAKGHFTLKNGQTAKFVGEISDDSDNPNSYYVVEDKDADADLFWNVPTWTYTAEVAGNETGTPSSINGQSMTVTATGSNEAEDSIAFTCTNIWVHQDKTSISAVDDRIVIDYGLPVVIDALANDTVSNGTKSIESVTGAQYGTADIKDGKIEYQLTKQLTGVEVLTYTVKATATSNVESDNKTATAKIYIIPATSMYYEEDFTGLVTFTNYGGAEWTSEGTAETDPQEPGVVGTVGDSPYGSDAAYRNDGGDSNGSSMYLNTTETYASFSYSFTGTGTSFFARTGATAAYMQVVVKKSDGTEVDNLRRNNIYKAVDGTDVGTLYNIPVYTIDGLSYGTYTVNVTVMKGVESLNRGNEFYLDGIRVINPLFDPADETHVLSDLEQIAQTAYAADGEANMTVVTLRQKLIGEAQTNEDDTISWNEGDNFVLFTDSDGEITSAEEYKSNGPKEEVYLNNGQSVTFSLANWDPNTNKIYLGIKAPVGSGTVSINGNTLNINNAADCYYDISSYASITTNEEGVQIATFEIKATSSLISVTNIKVTGNAIFTIVDQDDKTVTGGEGEEDSNNSVDVIVEEGG